MSRMKQVVEMVKGIDWDELDAERDARTGNNADAWIKKQQHAFRKMNKMRKNKDSSLATGADCDNMSGD